jgi:hypothetical protein
MYLCYVERNEAKKTEVEREKRERDRTSEK